MNPLVMALMAAARQRQSQGPLVYESVITPADFHIATRDGEAMFFHDSIDFSPYAGTDAGNTPYKFVLTDGAGKKAEAWGGAIGGGETLGADLFSGWDFTDGSWSTYPNATIVDSDTFTSTDGVGTGVFKGVFDYDRIVKLSIASQIECIPHLGNAVPRTALTPNSTSYGTMSESYHKNNYLYLRVSSTTTIDVTNLEAWHLTDIPPTGLHLMSSMDGTTRNMSLVESGFDPNNVTSIKIYRDANYLYDDTVSSLRISAVDGTAFIDNLPAAALGYVNGRNWVTITDSAGKKLEGVLKAKGTGETLGSELVTNGTFDTDTTGWTAGNNATLSIDTQRLKVTNGVSSGAGQGRQTVGVETGGLYIVSGDAINGTSTARISIDKDDYSWAGDYYAAYGVLSETYLTALTNALLWTLTEGTVVSGTYNFFDNISTKQVLTPSTSGCTIVDGELSTTQNFASVEAGFAFNESSYSLTITREREV